ncbi:CD63 antigen [Holothuria leucospilota]|uniref:Tetraspanin n=1 Tax=Holothuria leucospilota TaxID=206669 RepID=A0A9Q0YNJ2_HOLLE|nr:CD63 antigen [Holothuria leucospilota]
MAVKEILMFSLNLIIMAVGILLIVCGVFIITSEIQQLVTDISTFFHIIGIVFFAIGSILCLLALTGCCGVAIKHNYILTAYIAIMSFILLIEVTAFITFYILQTRRQKEAIAEIKDSMQLYHTDFGVEAKWDFIQNTSKCCGIDGPSDWMTNGNFDDNRVPESCCEEGVNSCMVQSAYTMGCFRKLGYFTQLEFTLSGVIAGILFLTEILGMVVAYWVAASPRPANWDKPL